MDGHHWTYAEWKENTIDKIVAIALSEPFEHRDDYLRVQLEAAIGQALRHGRAGRSEDEPVVS